MTKIFNRNSWHYYVAFNWGQLRGDPTNICEYIKEVITGLICCVTICTLSVAIIIAMLYPLWWLGLNLTHGFIFKLDIVIAVGLGIYAMIGILTVCWLTDRCWTYCKEYISKRNAPVPLANKPDSFLVEAYRSVKHKMCFNIDFTEDT